MPLLGKNIPWKSATFRRWKKEEKKIKQSSMAKEEVVSIFDILISSKIPSTFTLRLVYKFINHDVQSLAFKQVNQDAFLEMLK